MGPRPAALQNKGGRDGRNARPFPTYQALDNLSHVPSPVPSNEPPIQKPVSFFRSSGKDLRAFPPAARQKAGYRLDSVQHRIQRRYDDLTVARKRQGLQ
jgi:hypothetical protein